MKIKLFVIAAAIAALMSPLVASAYSIPVLPFSDLSSIDYSFTATPGNAKFTLIDLNTSTHRVPQKFTLTGGTLDPASSAEFIFEKRAVVEMSGLKINFNEYIDYDLGQDQAILSAYLFRAGPRSTAFSGPGDVNMYVPSNANFSFTNANPTGPFSSMSTTGTVNKSVTGYQYVMSGAVRVTATVKRDFSSARLAVGPIKPTEGYVHTVMANYSAAADANHGIHVVSETYQDFDVSGAFLPGGKITIVP